MDQAAINNLLTRAEACFESGQERMVKMNLQEIFKRVNVDELPHGMHKRFQNLCTKMGLKVRRSAKLSGYQTPSGERMF